MKKILLSSLLLVVTTILNAQTFEWAKSFGGTSSEQSLSMSIDAAGNIYTTGRFTGTVDFDPGAGTTNLTSTSAFESDIFIQKMDATGNFIWAKSFGGTSSDYCYSISVDSFGNAYTTGYFSGTIDFDPGAGTTNLTSTGAFDIFIQKLDSSGNFLWAKTLGGSSNDSGTSISISPSGDTYISGYFSGIADFDTGVGINNLVSQGTSDTFLLKLDTSGNTIWAKAFGGTSTSMSVDSLGNIYTGGFFYGTEDFDPNTGINNLTSAGESDNFVQKMDASGNFVWAKSFGGSGDDNCYSISVDNSGSVCTTGYFNTSGDYDPGVGVTNLAASPTGLPTVFIHKIDASGNFQWAKAIGGNYHEVGKSISCDSSGNIYTLGYFMGTIDFDPGAGTSNLTSAGSSDVFILKMDTLGNFILAKSFGGTDTDYPTCIKLDAAENIYTTGHFYATADFDPGVGTTNLTSTGDTDIFIQKMNPTVMSVNEFNNAKVSVYPNPTTGIVHLIFDKVINDIELIITDIQGKVIYKESHNTLLNADFELKGDIGIYFLTVKTTKGQKTIKLIKE